MTHSELLIRAADLIRDLAVATTQPWTLGEYPRDAPGEPNVLSCDGTPLFSSSCCGGSCFGYVSKPGDAAWIAALSPAAPQLEALFRATAGPVEIWTELGRPLNATEAAVLELAAAVLGEVSHG